VVLGHVNLIFASERSIAEKMVVAGQVCHAWPEYFPLSSVIPGLGRSRFVRCRDFVTARRRTPDC
jgi:hypothetical protein